MDEYPPEATRPLGPVVAVVSDQQSLANLDPLIGCLLISLRKADDSAKGPTPPPVKCVKYTSTHTFPARKAESWASADGTSLVDSRVRNAHVPDGIKWLYKHSNEVPCAVLYVVYVNLGSLEEWPQIESFVATDVRRLTQELAGRDSRVLVVLVGVGVSPSRDDRGLINQLTQSMRRYGLDARLIMSMLENECAQGSAPVKQLALRIRELAAAHYTAATVNLRRKEQLLIPFSHNKAHRILLAGLYFKLGCMYEPLVLEDRSAACFQESAKLVTELYRQAAVPLQEHTVPQADNDPEMLEDEHSQQKHVVSPNSRELIDKLRSFAELLNIRLVRHHLEHGMNPRAATLQFQQHLDTFAPMSYDSSSCAGSIASWPRHAWLAQQHNTFADQLQAYIERFPMMGDQPQGGGGWREVTQHVLAAASHAVRCRKAVSALENANRKQGFKQSQGLSSPTRQWTLPHETSAGFAEKSAAILQRALLLCSTRSEQAPLTPSASPPTGRLRRETARHPRRTLKLLHELGDELIAAGHHKEALEAWAKLPGALQATGWTELLLHLLPRIIECTRVASASAGGTTLSPPILATSIDACLRLLGRSLKNHTPADLQRTLFDEFLHNAHTLANIDPSIANSTLGPGVPGASPPPGGTLHSMSNGGSGDFSFSSFSGSAGAVGAGWPSVSVCPTGVVLTLDAHHELVIAVGWFEEKVAPAGEAVTLRAGLLSLAPKPLPLQEISFMFTDPTLKASVTTTGPSATPTMKSAVESFTGEMILQPGTVMWYATKLRLPLAPPAAPVALRSVRIALSGGSGSRYVTLAIPAGSDAQELKNTLSPFAVGDLSYGMSSRPSRPPKALFVTAPAPRATVRVVWDDGIGKTLLVKGALTPIHVAIDPLPGAPSLIGGKLKVACNPAPSSGASHDAFFWREVLSGTQQPGPQFEPMPLGSDMQPLDTITVTPTSTSASVDAEAGGAGERGLAKVWVRCNACETVRLSLQFEFVPPSSNSTNHSNNNSYSSRSISLGGPCTAVEKLTFGEALAASTEVLPLSDLCDTPHTSVMRYQAAGHESQPNEEVVCAGNTVVVRTALLSLQPHPLTLLKAELVRPTAAAGENLALAHASWEGPVLFDRFSADSSNDDSGSEEDAVVLQQNEVFTMAFRAMAPAAGLYHLGHMRVHWCRRSDEESVVAQSKGNTSSSVLLPASPSSSRSRFASLVTVTDLPLPVLRSVEPPLGVHLIAPPQAWLGKEFRISWEIQNRTNLHQDIQLRAEGGESFVWSGTRAQLVHLGPREKTSIEYLLVPLALGHVALPQFGLTPMRKQSDVVVNEAQEGQAIIFVCP